MIWILYICLNNTGCITEHFKTLTECEQHGKILNEKANNWTSIQPICLKKEKL